jgi:hypothetical protein
MLEIEVSRQNHWVARLWPVGENTWYFLAAWRIVDRPTLKPPASLAKVHLRKPHPAPVLRHLEVPLTDVKSLADIYGCPALELEHKVVFAAPGAVCRLCLLVDPRLLYCKKVISGLLKQDFQRLLVPFSVPE